MKRTPKKEIDKLVYKLINECLKHIKLEVLKEPTKVSLINFYQRQYNELRKIRGTNLLLLLACIKISNPDSELVKDITKSQAESIINTYGKGESYYLQLQGEYDTVILHGVPMQKFSDNYLKENVKPIFDRLSKQYPFDPDDYRGQDPNKAKHKHINSLRNRAEMEARYEGHLENINDLKEQGHRLVIASTHADCSERCSEWQGRVYSLDGTSGTAPDGRKYVPLEDATDVWYQTKAGKWYKNGLLGFNCRHYLVPYKDGYRFTRVNEITEEKEYEITKKQRQLERKVRYWRTEALTHKGVNQSEYQKARKKAIKANKEYIAYSHRNNRAYYPDRTKLI